jgi:RND family efflux transporter MFP subunit
MNVDRQWPMLAVILAIAACGRGDAGDTATSTPVVTVETARVAAANFSPAVRAIGVVVASPAGYAELSAPSAARISRVLVTSGQTVRAGQVLVELDVSALQADARGADAALAAAQSAYDRASRLSQQGILPRKAVDQARADLAQANAAAITARRVYTLSTLRSPISGVVTRMNAVTGASADPAQILVAIANPKELQVLLQLSPADAGSVRDNAVVTLSDSDSPSAAEVARGTVLSVGAAIDSTSRAVPVRVHITSSSRPLRLGETLSGRIALARSTDAIAVPAAALVPDSAGFRVYVVRDGTAYATPVEVGARSDSLVQITRGLTAGEIVVTAGAYGLADSSKVTVPGR